MIPYKKVVHNTCSVLILILIVFLPATVLSGPNRNAGCALDANPETADYAQTVSSENIETSIKARPGEIVAIAAVAQGTSDLDTYQIEVRYDPQVLEFVKTPKTNLVVGTVNFLGSKGGTCFGFESVDPEKGTINVSNSIAGNIGTHAPEGSGTISVLHFRILQNKPAKLKLENVVFMASDGVADRVERLAGAAVN